MPCMKKIYKDNKKNVHWSAARTEERVLPRGYVNRWSNAGQTRVKRGSNTVFVSPSV